MNPAFLKLKSSYPDLAECLDDISAAYEILRDAFAAGGKLLICGNGGSAADADHIVGELAKGFLLRRRIPTAECQQLQEEFGETGRELASHLQGALPAIALSAHTALATAFANDVAPHMGFAQQVYAYARPGDVLLGISTSGNSANVLHALRVAKFRGAHTIGLTGRTGGAMPPLCDITIGAPSDQTPQIQERHLPIYHALCVALEAHFFTPDAVA